MEIWIPVTIAAAFVQNIRSATQRHLKEKLKTLGATFVRFGFGLPFVILFVAIMVFGFGRELPSTNPQFWFWVVLGGTAQIAAQALLLKVFTLSNFTVGTAYSRTEAVQAALIGLVLLGDRIDAQTITAILITVFGVVLISIARTKLDLAGLVSAFGSRAARIGLLSGTVFGVSAVSYRGASLSLEAGMAEPDFMMQAGITLLATITLQTFALLLWMIVFDRNEIRAVLASWKWGLVAGASGATASFGWFIGFTLQSAAAIKALAQVEMVFTYLSSVFIFGETITRREITGCGLIVAGIILLVL